jgi:tetratricopeptide (TPR) repeat protein
MLAIKKYVLTQKCRWFLAKLSKIHLEIVSVRISTGKVRLDLVYDAIDLIENNEHLLTETFVDLIRSTDCFGKFTAKDSYLKAKTCLLLVDTFIHYQENNFNFINCTDIAFAFYLKSLEFCGDLNSLDSETLTSFTYIKAIIYNLKNRKGEEYCLLPSLNIFNSIVQKTSPKLNPQGYHQTIASRAFVQEQLGHHEVAVEDYLSALEFFRREQFPLEWARIKLDLGVSLASLRQFDRAIESFEFALTVFAQGSGDPRPQYSSEWGATHFYLSQSYYQRFLQSSNFSDLNKALFSNSQADFYYSQHKCCHHLAHLQLIADHRQQWRKTAKQMGCKLLLIS